MFRYGVIGFAREAWVGGSELRNVHAAMLVWDSVSDPVKLRIAVELTE